MAEIERNLLTALFLDERLINFAVGSSSPESERENAPSISEQLGKKDKKRNRSGANRTCSTCQKNLSDCVKSWSDVGSESLAFCLLLKVDGV